MWMGRRKKALFLVEEWTRRIGRWRLLDHLEGEDVKFTLIRGADHRFSNPECLMLELTVS